METQVDQKSSSSTIDTSIDTQRSNPNIDIDTSLTIGREFSTFKELEQVLEARKQASGERWRISKSKLYSTYNKNLKKREKPTYYVPEKLQYSELGLRCIHEGDRNSLWCSKRPAKFRKM